MIWLLDAILSAHDPLGILFMLGVATINPPWRLDPMQNIVNISWGKDTLAVEFGDKDQDAPGMSKKPGP